MIDQDFEQFTVEVRRLATVLRLRASPTELTQITNAYFKAFKRRPLSAVVAGADAWIERGDKFPKPAQWLGVMPRRDASGQVSALTRDEADEWQQAERQAWEGRPCGCVLCIAAEITDKPLRFVPDIEGDGRDARGTIGEREVTRGHWAHGDELVRWYHARAQFYDTYLALFPNSVMSKRDAERASKVRFEQRLEEIFAKRRPAERPASTFQPLVDVAGAREPGEEG